MNICSITAKSNVPSTFGRSTRGYGMYASNCIDYQRAIHKCRPVTHQWIWLSANV